MGYKDLLEMTTSQKVKIYRLLKNEPATLKSRDMEEVFVGVGPCVIEGERRRRDTPNLWKTQFRHILNNDGTSVDSAEHMRLV